jgi:F-type H+-transporting ATPase subunit delta
MSAEPLPQSRSVMDDPTVQSVAKVYAVGLLEAAEKAGGAAGVVEEFGSFLTEVLDRHPDFERLLCTSITSQEAKLSLIDRVLAPRGTPLFVNLLRVLAKHERLEIVRGVHAAVVREQERRAGQIRVQVTSATPLSAEALESLRARLAQTMSASPLLEPVVDADLLGGLVIRVGDTVYDGSVRNRLRQLRGKLRERCLNEVQRGRDRFSHSAGN